MKIRSITCFINPHFPLEASRLHSASKFVNRAREAIEKAGYEVQTTRLASVPFPTLVPSLDKAAVCDFAQELGKCAQQDGFDFFSLGPAIPSVMESYALIPSLLSCNPNLFVSGAITTPAGEISLPATRSCAAIIHQASRLSPDGFANLRFTALANVAAGSPFFPAAYHQGDAPAFALATEAADLAIDAIQNATDLNDARNRLVGEMEKHGRRLTEIANALAAANEITFKGVDFSLAPYPGETISIGKAIELLGAPAVGLHGSLAAVGFLTEAVERAHFPHAGFSGVMLPVLEDSILARRAASGNLSVTDLMLYSAVCGTGLDTVPLPGDTSEEQLYAILIDLAMLALRLNKPLTARLMPIPGKAAGEATDFDFSYFANSRILPVEAEPLQGLFDSSEIVAVQPRKVT